MKITVFGAGYVGLVQSAALAEVGHHVICVDTDHEKLKRIEAGEIPFYEPNLSELVMKNRKFSNLAFTSDAAVGVNHGEVIFIAVGTPSSPDGSADLSYVMSVAGSIGRLMNEPKTVVVKSTVPIGTGKSVENEISLQLKSRGIEGLCVDVVSNPEFLREGSALEDFMRPDRIVIGSASRNAEAIMRGIYAPFNRNREKIIVMDVESAEMTKYVANSFLATKISFMNEMAEISERFGADIESVRRGIGSDHRIGYDFMYAGAGYGGACFPKDVSALISMSQGAGVDPGILLAVKKRNDRQKSVIFEKIYDHFSFDLSGLTFALWGLSFKPNTDDMREAPSKALIDDLLAAGAKVQAYDPEAIREAKMIYGERDGLVFGTTKESVLEGADALVIMTEWQCFKSPDFGLIKELLSSPLIFDGRNIFYPQMMRARGIVYRSVGRK